VTKCTGQIDLFSIGRRKVTIESNGTFITSNAGVLLASRIEQRLGLAEQLSEVLRDEREPALVRHTYESQMRQRLLQIACGYEDCNDATELRHEPAFLTAMGRVAGQEESALASQPTLSRFEQRDAGELLRMSEVLVDLWIDQLLARGPKAWKKIVLEFDSTDDPTHGAQQLSMFHGYYDQYMYHPLLVFDGEGWPVAVVLRPGRASGSQGAASVLLRIFKKIVERLPRQAQIILRADAGFAIPELYELCETMGIRYVIGQVTHASYKARATEALAEAVRQFEATGIKAQVFTEFEYQAETWSRSRRVIGKAERMPEGENLRFIVTNIDELDPEAAYDHYTKRGQSENFIKDLKNAMFADRLSCSAFMANQFRLLLHTAAYIVMLELRRELVETALANAQMDTLRVKLLKIGACIVVTARHIWVQLSEFDPSRHLFELVCRRLAPAPT
jgi:hypothetical protein